MDRLAQLQRLHESDPGDAFCMYALALEHAKRGDAAQALTWFDRTIAADPNYCYAYFHKAKSQAASGDASAAADTLRIGLRQAQAARDLKAAGEIEAFLDEVS